MNNLPPHLQNINQNLSGMIFNNPNMPHLQNNLTNSSGLNMNINIFNNDINKISNKSLQIKIINKTGKLSKNIKNIKKSKLARKKWKVLRRAGGEVWEDPTLEEWSENDYRIFCGDLGNEVTDEILATAFRKYPSFIKARVIRDKRTGKSRGFGFISLREASDYMKAMKEMHGKYVGNRPIRLKKSTWKDRSLLHNKCKVDTVKYKKNRSKIRTKNLVGNNNNQNNNVYPNYSENNNNTGSYPNIYNTDINIGYNNINNQNNMMMNQQNYQGMNFGNNYPQN